ncbi:hypothetical protein YPC_2832 [Yersinia pestis biovar Medievalis str. Harbin 35]|uniref:Uncharacterized protein n=3 Tax=Yersinia pestis TaxID=632 RepID=Q8CKV0_YERPE
MGLIGNGLGIISSYQRGQYVDHYGCLWEEVIADDVP